MMVRLLHLQENHKRHITKILAQDSTMQALRE